MDSVALAIIGGSVGFALLLGFGLWLAAHRAKRRELAARSAAQVTAPIRGPIFNRRSLSWAGGLFVLSFALGALTKKGGVIDQSSGWAGGLVGLVFAPGMAGFIREASRKIGALKLDRGANTLTLSVGENDRSFSLNEPFEYGESTLLPSGLYTYGGTVVRVSQGSTRGSFWFVHARSDLQTAQREARGEPDEAFKTNGLGRVIRDHLRGISTAV